MNVVVSSIRKVYTSRLCFNWVVKDRVEGGGGGGGGVFSMGMGRLAGVWGEGR